MTDSDLAANIERFFSRLQIRVKQELADASDENGMIPTEKADRILQRCAEIFNELFDRIIERSGSVHPGLAEALRGEFEPWRELLRKSITDRLRPH